MGALERAREDIEAGRLWKARDRLQGYLHTSPRDQEALALLAHVCDRMGDLPAAGKYLFLTDGWADDGAVAAREAFEERYGWSPFERLRALPARPPLEAYPPEVAGRLGKLVEEAREDGFHWVPVIEKPAAPVAGLSRWSKGLADAVLLAIALLTIGVWLLGVVFLLQLIF